MIDDEKKNIQYDGLISILMMIKMIQKKDYQEC